MLVFLIGYMGSGKSSVGRKLATRLGYDFIDTDKEIEKEYGGSVREMFEKEGEDFFREREREMLVRLGGREGDIIIATGGGMPCKPGNVELMNELGYTIYLKMSPAKLAARLEGGRDKRPVIRGLNDKELLDFIKTNLELREPFYNKAVMALECDDVGDEDVCSQAERYISVTAGQRSR